MLYLVHELSPMRGAVFLIEIYLPVSLNPPKWPLFEKSETFLQLFLLNSAELLLCFDNMMALD